MAKEVKGQKKSEGWNEKEGWGSEEGGLAFAHFSQMLWPWTPLDHNDYSEESSGDEEHNVWNHMLGLVRTRHVQSRVRSLREEDACMVALSCHFALAALTVSSDVQMARVRRRSGAQSCGWQLPSAATWTQLKVTE